MTDGTTESTTQPVTTSPLTAAADTGRMRRCPVCQLVGAGTWCERCGEALVEMAGGSAPRWLSSAASTDNCGSCGASAVGTDGYCERCGHRNAAGQDRAELDLGTVAAVTDRGRRRTRNEDAVAIGRHGEVTVAAVCDGVSSSTRPEEAAVAAAITGVRTLLEHLAPGTDTANGQTRDAEPESATMAAVLAAAEAATAAAERAAPLGPDGPPCCTYVSAVVTDSTVTIGWVGDSRAYWVGPDGAECLTVDDSLAGQLQAHGVDPADSRFTDPRAYALLAWLGADAEDVTPHVVSFSPPAGGFVVVCSDGLSRYLAEPEDLATMVTAAADVAGGDTPAVVARYLTQRALDCGGHDNIGIAVLRFAPAAPSDTPDETPQH